MSDDDIMRATGITRPFLAGIRATESGGKPGVVRFEPHLFRRFHPDSVRVLPLDAADADRVAAWNAGLIPHTPHEGGPEHKSLVRVETNRDAFEHAYKIDAVAAVRSTSWGTWQVLGGHLLALWPNRPPSHAVAAFEADPAGISDRLLVAWLHANPRALEAAVREDVDGFIHYYNGCPRDQTAKYRQRFDPAYRAAGGRLL